MESENTIMRLKILNIENGGFNEESQKQMVLTAFKYFGQATDWEVKSRIEQQYGIKIHERNWVSARRGDLISEGLIEATDKRRIGEFGKPCIVWKFNSEGKKHDPNCLTSNEMNRVIKYLNDKCRIANQYQKEKMMEIIQRYEELS